MSLFLIILFFFVDSSRSLQCITNCSIENIKFNETFQIPNGQCQQRISSSECFISLEFNYFRRTYRVAFKDMSTSMDFIYINSPLYLTYDISYRCSKETNCVISYATKRISEMIARDYNAARIYQELAPLIENPLRNGSIQCYDTRHNIISCSRGYICSLNYDPIGKKARSRGCALDADSRVFVSDGITYGSLTVECDQNLCNGDGTLEKIKTILANNGLTDLNGRRIAGATKDLSSYLLIIFTMFCSILFMHH